MKKQIKTESDTNAKNDTNAGDGIEILKSATCPNLAGKAKLVYQIGRSPKGRVQVRIVKNSSSGCFSDDWFDLDALWQEMAKNSPGDGPVTSGDVMKCFAGRSQNTCGFVFAALKAEEFVITSRQRRRAYDRVDTATYEAKSKALLEGKAAKTGTAKKAVSKTADGQTTKRTAKAPRKQKLS